MTEKSRQIRIVEVGPRDGLQDAPVMMSVEDRVRLIELCADMGADAVELGVFGKIKRVGRVPEILSRLQLKPGVSYTALVPNVRGTQEALAAGVSDLAFFTATTDTFVQKNINCRVEDSLVRLDQIFECVRAGQTDVRVRGYLSGVFRCPITHEPVEPAHAAILVSRLLEKGCYEVSLGDTTGVGTPDTVRALLQAIDDADIPMEKISVHFHDTGGRALENIRVALDKGVRSIDSAIGGLGGCPYAQSVTGNVATEGVISLLDQLGFSSGVDQGKMHAAKSFLGEALKRGEPIA